MVEKIDLHTRTGEFVTTVQIPRFRPHAEGIQWGERTFFRREDGKYYEGVICLAVLDTTEGEEGGGPTDGGG